MVRKVKTYVVTAHMPDGKKIPHNIAAFNKVDARKDFRRSFPAAAARAKRVTVALKK